MNWYWFVIALTIGKQRRNQQRRPRAITVLMWEQGSGTLEVIEHALKPKIKMSELMEMQLEVLKVSNLI
jgi:hypothetical protein